MTLLTLSAIWEIFITLSCPTKSLTTYILCEIKVGANEKFSNLLGFRKKENTAILVYILVIHLLLPHLPSHISIFVYLFPGGASPF